MFPVQLASGTPLPAAPASRLTFPDRYPGYHLLPRAIRASGLTSPYHDYILFHGPDAITSIHYPPYNGLDHPWYARSSQSSAHV
jgi:hypothetical protein